MVYRENIGWIWTDPQVFPSLYVHDKQKWTFLSLNQGPTILYDYLASEWFELDKPYAILGGANDSVGGDIAGLGYYYRWQPVRLEAITQNGYEFLNWSGGLSGNNRFGEFEATRDLSVTAIFKSLNNTPTTGKDPEKPRTLEDLTPTDREKPWQRF